MLGRVALLALLLAPPLLATWAGAPGPRSLRLNLGPGDAPYIEGFEDAYDVADGRALQWSHREARIELPLEYEGDAELLLRFGPPRGGEARIDLALDSRPLATFLCCPEARFERRRFRADASRPTRLALDLRVAGPDDRLGLLMDWVQLELGATGRVRLRDHARLRPAALVAVTFLVLVLVGLRSGGLVLSVLPLSLLLALGLRSDPWVVHRLLTWLPESVLVLGLLVAFASRLLMRRNLLSPEGGRLAATVALAAFVVRAAAVNHPDFYHPDLMSHARRTLALRAAGAEAWLNPTRALGLEEPRDGVMPASGRTKIGLYYYRIGGRLYPLPYTLAPYVPAALFPLDYDRTITAIRLLGAAASALPILLVAVLARALGAPEWASALLFAAPTPVVELSLASVPALVGHLPDLVLVAFLALRVRDLGERAVAFQGILLLALAQLVYISSPITTTFLLATLSAVALGIPGLRAPVARGALLILGAGSALSVLLYYRHFVPGAIAAVRAAVGAPTTTRASELGGGRLDGSLLAFALPLVLVLALVGARRLVSRDASARAVLGAAFLSLLLVALLRLRVPVVFGYVHLALLATPLLCVAAGTGLQVLAARLPWGPKLAAALAAAIVAQGSWLQARAYLEALGRAR